MIINEGEERRVNINRRNFVKGSMATAGLFSLNGCMQTSLAKLRQPGERLNMAFVGTGGRGADNLREFYQLGEQVVALCDVDTRNIARAADEVKERCAGARQYQDYREMLTQEKDLDAVVISTPDHMHAAVALSAMRKGCHVYVEKPLVRTVWEAQRFAQVAKKCGVVTQMGNNGNGSDNQRRLIEVVGSGVLGQITAIHVSTDRPIWPQAIERPTGSDPIPEHLDWDCWLGVAPERPYKNGVYHSFKWRGWYDFGTGAMGDIACHSMSFFWRALQLTTVISAETIKTTGKFPETYPAATTVKLVVRSDKQAQPITIYWYDGKTHAAPEVSPEAVATWGQIGVGTILIQGAQGQYANGAVCMQGETKFRGIAQHEATKDIPVTLPRVKGHHWEFAEAIRGGATPLSHYDHAVPLTEAVLLGCVSQRVEGELLWDVRRSRFSNSREANQLLKPYIRPQWVIG